MFQFPECDRSWPIKSRPNHITKRIKNDAFRVWIGKTIPMHFFLQDEATFFAVDSAIRYSRNAKVVR